jgi:hypothetical protein
VRRRSGRHSIAHHELAPFTVDEVVRAGRRVELERLWLRGGFPDSYLAEDDEASWEWRGQFVDTWLERDVPLLGPRMPATGLRRLWSMLALGQGDQLNAAKLASGLGVAANTLRSWLDVLTDLCMVRQLPAWSGNSRKRLVKAPKIYVRDAGLVHRLAQLPDTETLLGHPVCGRSWEGFVIEQLVTQLTNAWQVSYYRTSAQAEIDLVLEGPRRQVLAVEIKRASAPTPSKGFLLGCEDIGATRRYLVMPAGEAHSVGHDTEAIALADLVDQLGAGKG